MTEYRDLAATENQETCALPIDEGPGGGARFQAALTLRRAGDLKHVDSKPLPRHLRLLAGLGIAQDRLFTCRQVHSRRVLTVRRRDPSHYAREEADGLICDLEDVVLAVTVADCLPIFLTDRRRGAFAIVHSGWKGTGIVREALSGLRREYGSQSKDLRAMIGPGIGSCCYEVDAGRFTRFRAEFGDLAVSRRNSKYYLDLRTANLALLEEAGVEDVLVIRDCTVCNPLLSSYRRDGIGHYCNMLAMIARSGLITEQE
jgi:YfiH family protein